MKPSIVQMKGDKTLHEMFNSGVTQPSTTAVFGAKNESKASKRLPNIFDTHSQPHQFLANPNQNSLQFLNYEKRQDNRQVASKKQGSIDESQKNLFSRVQVQRETDKLQNNRNKQFQAQSISFVQNKVETKDLSSLKNDPSIKRLNDIKQANVKIGTLLQGKQSPSAFKMIYKGIALIQKQQKLRDGSIFVTVEWQNPQQKRPIEGLPNKIEIQFPKNFKLDQSKFKSLQEYAFNKYTSRIDQKMEKEQTEAERRQKRMKELMDREEKEMKRNGQYLRFSQVNEVEKVSVRQLFEYIRANDAPWNMKHLAVGDFIQYPEERPLQYMNKAVSEVQYAKQTQFYEPTSMKPLTRADLIKILVFATYPESYECLQKYNYFYLQQIIIPQERYMSCWPLHAYLLPHYIELYNIKQLYLYSHWYDELASKGQMTFKVKEKCREMMRTEMEKRKDRYAAQLGLKMLRENEDMYENVQEICKNFEILEQKLTGHIVQLVQNHQALFEHVNSIISNDYIIKNEPELFDNLFESDDILQKADGLIFGVVPFISKYSIISIVIPTVPGDKRADCVVPIDFIYEKNHLHEDYLGFEQQSFIWKCHNLLSNIFKHPIDTYVYGVYFKAFFVLRYHFERLWSYVRTKREGNKELCFEPSQGSKEQLTVRQVMILKQIADMKEATQSRQ